MALIKCTECGNEVSDKASSCPKCGAPIEKVDATNTQTQKEHPKKEQPKEEPKVTSQQQVEPKKKGIAPWKIIVPLLIILLIGVLFVIMQNNPNAIPGIKLEINTPKPVVVTSRANDGNSSLFKEKTTIYTTIQNQGGDGNVLVTFHVYQDGNDYNKSKSIYMTSNQNIDMEETFTEVKRLGGEITYHVDAITQ